MRVKKIEGQNRNSFYFYYAFPSQTMSLDNLYYMIY